MKPFIRSCCVLALIGIGCPAPGLTQATGPSAFSKKNLIDNSSKPGLHDRDTPIAFPGAPGWPDRPGMWPSCAKEERLIDELEKTVALQSKRIEQLESAVKLAGKGVPR